MVFLLDALRIHNILNLENRCVINVLFHVAVKYEGHALLLYEPYDLMF
jgi:hypothetical protein